jgi:Ca2+/Na+ antiporter
LPGGLAFAGGTLLLALTIGTEPRYVAELLPAMLLTGAGVGLSFAAFSSAAVAELPRTRFATGSAIASCFRQIGAVLGISGLIALLGTSSSTSVLHAYHRAWTLMAVTGAVAALTALALGRVRARHAGDEATALPLVAEAEPS